MFSSINISCESWMKVQEINIALSESNASCILLNQLSSINCFFLFFSVGSSKATITALLAAL